MGSDSDEDIQSIGSSDGNLDIVVPARNKPSRRAATKVYIFLIFYKNQLYFTFANLIENRLLCPVG